MTIENARALQEQLANEAIAQLRKNGNNELVDDCIQSIAVVGKDKVVEQNKILLPKEIY